MSETYQYVQICTARDHTWTNAPIVLLLKVHVTLGESWTHLKQKHHLPVNRWACCYHWEGKYIASGNGKTITSLGTRASDNVRTTKQPCDWNDGSDCWNWRKLPISWRQHTFGTICTEVNVVLEAKDNRVLMVALGTQDGMARTKNGGGNLKRKLREKYRHLRNTYTHDRDQSCREVKSNRKYIKVVLYCQGTDAGWCFSFFFSFFLFLIFLLESLRWGK